MFPAAIPAAFMSPPDSADLPISPNWTAGQERRGRGVRFGGHSARHARAVFAGPRACS